MSDDARLPDLSLFGLAQAYAHKQAEVDQWKARAEVAEGKEAELMSSIEFWRGRAREFQSDRNRMRDLLYGQKEA